MKVSVLLITYNHAPFIRQAIEGALRQQANSDFEIVIGEDDSADGTREIVRQYQAEHPEQIRLVLNERKDVIHVNGRATGQWNLINTWRHIRGQYVALLEGDDYWTDPLKLQKQADYLDGHPECSLCFHDVTVVYEDGSPSHPYPFAARQPVYTLAEFLDRRAVPPTCSVMMRHGLFADLPEWFRRISFADQPLFVLCAEHGDLGFLDENMGVYRIHGGGLWSSGLRLDAGVTGRLPKEVTKSRYIAEVDFYEVINAHLAYKYHQVLRERISELCYKLVWIHQTEGDWSKMRKYLLKAYRAKLIVPEFPWTFVVKASLVAFFSFFYRFYRMMKPPCKTVCKM